MRLFACVSKYTILFSFRQLACFCVFLPVPVMRINFVGLLWLMTFFGSAQSQPCARNAFLNQELTEAFDYWNIANPNTSFHSSFKPYLSNTFSQLSDSLVPFRFYGFNNQYGSKTLQEKTKKRTHFNFQVLPVADFSAGYDPLAQSPVTNAVGGVHLKTNINNNFTFAFTGFGGRMSFPFFNDTVIAKQKLIPELGQAYGSNAAGYTFFDYTGYLSYTAGKSRVFNFQMGRDKHFIGDGYRSLLLSDFGAAYPYFRINTNIWRLQYSVWYTWMYDVSQANGIKSNYSNKYGTFHYLSYNITKEFNIGLFENVVWRGTDSNQVRTFDVNYLNPIVFYRPQEYSIGSPDNSFLGVNMSGIVLKKIKLYGQLALDEFFLKEIRARRGWWANKQGWQLGFKYINAFGIRGLKLQMEYNQVRPYTYTHGLVEQNYSHYGQPLAHPLGANFKEYVGMINYRKNKYEFGFQVMFAKMGKDTAGTHSNVGQNIFLSYNTRSADYGNHTGQGIRTTLAQSQLKFTWFLVPELNLRLELSYIQRSERNSQKYLLQNPYFSLGLKTSFWNSYRDF